MQAAAVGQIEALSWDWQPRDTAGQPYLEGPARVLLEPACVTSCAAVSDPGLSWLRRRAPQPRKSISAVVAWCRK